MKFILILLSKISINIIILTLMNAIKYITGELYFITKIDVTECCNGYIYTFFK